MDGTDRGIGRLALEGLVVVASILLAFVLDAWWEGREIEEQLREELVSVGREVEENTSLVAFEINTLERIIAAGEATTRILEADPLSELVAVPDSLVWFVAFWSPTLDLSFGALEALIASGRLAQIEDAGLKQRLAGLRGRVVDVVGDELLAQGILMDRIFPAVAERADLSSIYRIDRAFFAEERRIDRPVPFGEGSTAVVNTQRLRNDILNRASWLGSGLSELRRLQPYLDSVSVRIGDEIRR